jgi:hypothetical protein
MNKKDSIVTQNKQIRKLGEENKDHWNHNWL